MGKARAALCYVAVRELKLSCAFLAEELRISPSAVSKSTVRGRRALNDAVIQRWNQGMKQQGSRSSKTSRPELCDTAGQPPQTGRIVH